MNGFDLTQLQPGIIALGASVLTLLGALAQAATGWLQRGRIDKASAKAVMPVQAQTNTQDARLDALEAAVFGNLRKRVASYDVAEQPKLEEGK